MNENISPLVTIITCVYNTGQYLIDPLNSIINQTYTNYEHIIIDDGSNDNSVEIVKKWIEDNKYECRLIVHEENKGICPTLNEAIQLAQGKYLTIIGDDLMVPDKLEKDVTFLECNADVAYCYSNMIVRDLTTGKESFLKTSSAQPFFMSLLKGRIRLTSPTHTYRTDIFKLVGKYDETLSFEDMDMVLRIASQYPIGYIDYTSVIYCRHNTNFHFVKGETYFKDKEKVMLKWKHIPDFWIHFYTLKQQTFDYYSDKNKRMALRYLFPSLLIFWRLSLYKSLFKFLFLKK